MPKETKEEKMARLAAQRLEAKQAEEVAKSQHLASLPKRLLQMQAISESLGISTNVRLTESGVKVRFFDTSRNFDETVDNDTEIWEFDYTERRIKEFKEEHDLMISRIAKAQNVFGSLSDDDKKLLKEFIHLLK